MSDDMDRAQDNGSGDLGDAVMTGSPSREPEETKRSTLCPWFDEGNVVLRTENTLFRVHRDILSYHSIVFREMFAIPQPLTQTIMDGAVVIDLPDKADHVGYMLEALYNGFGLFRLEVSRASYWMLAGILRMASKYMISALRKGAKDVLFRAYPMSFDLSRVVKRELIFEESFINIAFDAVTLLTETNLVSCLPVALQDCCAHTYATLLGAGDKGVVLSDENRQRAVIGKGRLVAAWGGILEATFSSPSQRCEKRCGVAIRNAMRTWLMTENITFLGIRNDTPISDHVSSDICEQCVRVCKDRFQVLQADLWPKLPGIFGLPQWSELRKIDEESD